jgi:hypothetical protein
MVLHWLGSLLLFLQKPSLAELVHTVWEVIVTPDSQRLGFGTLVCLDFWMVLVHFLLSACALLVPCAKAFEHRKPKYSIPQPSPTQMQRNYTFSGRQ